MSAEHVVMILVGIISAVGGWWSSRAKSAPDREKNSTDRIQLIITHYENLHKMCEERNVRMCEENRVLRERNRSLKHQLREEQKGGE